jgi:TetR/AcrR family transcriptional regulator, regulator of autoinduction and epiphytic fitness
MSAENTPKRSYDSSRRKQSARQTRHQILEAARQLFITRGYAGASIDAIAEAAGVAVETVYAAFGNKRTILSGLIGVTLVGDDDPTPLLQRQSPQEALHEKSQARQLELFASDMAGIMERMAPLFEVMRVAAKTEAEIQTMFQRILAERVEGMKIFVRALLENGPLKEGLTLESAAETVWALSSGEVYTLLVKDRGWKAEKYQRWLARSLRELLLPVEAD